MVTFAGLDHVAFTVTDLDVSQRFYTQVLDFVLVMDVGYGRVCMHPTTGFVLALVRHPGAYGGAFDELRTGVDHLGLAAQTREELEEWERRFDEHGVTYTPIRDMEMGYHLNFRDPDDIASRAWSSATGPGLDGPKRDRLVGTGQVGASTRRHFVPRPAVRWVGRRRQRGHVERPAGSGIFLRWRRNTPSGHGPPQPRG